MQGGVFLPFYGREGRRDMLTVPDSKLHQSARPKLFDAAAFFDIADAVSRVRGSTGSGAMQLPEAEGVARPVSGAIPIVQ